MSLPCNHAIKDVSRRGQGDPNYYAFSQILASWRVQGKIRMAIWLHAMDVRKKAVSLREDVSTCEELQGGESN